jgi:hypothetical protein
MTRVLYTGVALLCLAAAGTAVAAPKTEKGKDTAAASAPAAGSVSETDIIGSKEAPAVSNIVPWKEKAVVIPKREVNTSILRETQQPLDRDVLRREIELQDLLSKQ